MRVLEISSTSDVGIKAYKKDFETKNKVFQALKKDCMRSLCTLITKHISPQNVFTAIARHINIELSISCVLSCILPLRLESKVRADGLLVPTDYKLGHKEL